jgi:FtsH-binding integral membrane protein
MLYLDFIQFFTKILKLFPELYNVLLADLV